MQLTVIADLVHMHIGAAPPSFASPLTVRHGARFLQLYFSHKLTTRPVELGRKLVVLLEVISVLDSVELATDVLVPLVVTTVVTLTVLVTMVTLVSAVLLVGVSVVAAVVRTSLVVTVLVTSVVSVVTITVGLVAVVTTSDMVV